MLTLTTVSNALTQTFGTSTPFTVYTEGNILVMRVNGVTAQVHNWQSVSLAEIVSTAQGIRLNESTNRQVLLNG